MKGMTGWDRFTAAFAPRWTLERVRARAALDTMQRHYEAAQPGRRTSGWARNRGDANALAGVAIAELRMHARDLARNNGWAGKARRVIANNTTGGWGLTPRPTGPYAALARTLWTAWADTTDCDADGISTFSGMQHLVMRTIATDGEVLLRKRPRRVIDGLAIPLQVEVLEADHLDTSRDRAIGQEGGPIIHGVEHDALGRRVAYWLFPEHPGGANGSGVSRRVPASEVQPVFYRDRPKQVRGVSWFAAGIVPVKDLDEFEDAELMRQKIAACFAGFVTDIDGAGAPLGALDEEAGEEVESLEPGMIRYLAPGQQVQFASPPATTTDGFTARHLRKAAAAFRVTYEDLTGDYSQSNFSSARMARLAHWADVRDWQWNMLVPQMCQVVWGWAMEAAVLAGKLPEVVGAEWTAPPMPMIEPDREGLAISRLVRNGVKTPSEVIREQGGDPASFWVEYARDLQQLDELGIVLDSDARRVTQAGLSQERNNKSATTTPGGES
jgi:lambda family phage portal protein